MTPVPLSVLDLAPIVEGSTPGDALRNSLDLAQHAERLGYRRHWVAEHHNMAGIASAATAVVVGYLAAGTSTIRVGAGGIMLPNHSPLVIAEQFGTLEALYPGRIDLGLGRAPGTDQLTARALRRDPASETSFPQDVQDLQFLLGPVQPGQAIRAVPGAGTEVPLWILGSSTFGARLAALLGLPYAFASHFAPARPDGRPRALPQRVPTLRPARGAVRDGGAERLRGRHGRGGTAALHDAAAVVGESLSWPPGTVSSADRRHRGVLDPGREGAGVGDAGAVRRRLTGDGAGRPGAIRRTARAWTRSWPSRRSSTTTRACGRTRSWPRSPAPGFRRHSSAASQSPLR